MADFNLAIGPTLQNEGQYEIQTTDLGAYFHGALIGSAYGISAPTLAQYLGRTPTIADMKGLTVDTAKAIYKKQYWDVIRGDEIKNQLVANKLFDTFVNTFKEAIILAQRTLGIKETGVMDNATLLAINQIN